MKPNPHQALLIAVQDYQHLQPLRTPLNDIQALGQTLETKYGYAVHTCKNPTLDKLRAFLQRIAEALSAADSAEDTFVLIYFAGHGVAQDSEVGIRGYLLPADSKIGGRQAWYPMAELMAVMDNLPTQHTLVLLDCCFGGTLRWASKHRGVAIDTEQGKLYRQHYRHFLERRSCQAITSSAPDQLALDFVRGGTETGHSPFAECIIRGLQGEADVVPDKAITCAELFAYLQNRLTAVSSRYGNPQNASLFPLDKHDFGEYLFFMDGFDPDSLELLGYHNPYRGLSPYGVEDRQHFFGRSAAIEALMKEVGGNPLTVVLGASGTGKSSLVKAGIVPRLPGGKEGKIPVIQPGLKPLAELPGPGAFDTLVIDQLEQLVTQAEEKEARAFLQKMAELLESGKKIIATLRIDYESRLPLPSELEKHWRRYLVPPFSAEELREAIITPAFRQGRFFVPMSLVGRIIEEVIHYPGALPLLSFTMQQLFERCKDSPYRNITPEDYEALGGVIGALQKRADAVYASLPGGAHQNTMRCLMLRMVSLTGGQPAGKRVLVESLQFESPEENERMKTVRGRMEAERLIRADTGQDGKMFIEPVHDALVNVWPKLAEWIKSFGIENLILLSRLNDATLDYLSAPEEGRLWAQTANLRQAKSPEVQGVLNKFESAFLQKSQQLEEDRFEESERRRKEAEEARARAEKNLRAATNTALVLQTAKTDPTLALRIAAYNLEHHPEYAAAYAVFHDIISDTRQAFYRQTMRGGAPIDYIFSVAFSPDGQSILTGHWDRKARLWTLDGQLLQNFTGHKGSIRSVAFSPDGRSILTGSGDKTAKRWTLDGEVITTFEGHESQVNAVAFAPDGRTILTGSKDKTAKSWTLDGKAITTFEGHQGAVTAVAFSPDGQTILTGGSDQTAKTWTLGGQAVTTFEGSHSQVTSAVFSPDGKTILTASESWDAILWALDGQPIATLSGHQGRIASAVFSPNGKTILTGSGDWTAKIWTPDGKLQKTLTGHQSALESVAFSPDGQFALTGSLDGTARTWPIGRELHCTYAGHQKGVSSVAFSSDGQTILTGSADKTAKIWSIDGKLLATLEGHQTGIKAVAFSPDRKAILTGSHDQTAKLWTANGEPLRTLSGHSGEVNAVAFSPSGETILTGSADKTAKAWRADGTTITTLEGHQGAVWAVAFSPDGKSILTGGSQLAHLWTAEGQLLTTFEGHENPILSVAFSPDGKLVLTGSSDETARLWTLDGKQIRSLHADPAGVNSVAFSPDGTMILTAGVSETARLWTLEGQPLATYSGHEDYIYSVAFSPDGRSILTGSYDNTAKRWLLPQALLEERTKAFTREELREQGVQLEMEGRGVIWERG
ncbi:MAG: caspase family protein [Lewinellaceae bacterium]|nr:caspase family protein [Lewinellaceae bacterium]